MKKNVLLQKAIKQNTVRKRWQLWKKVVSAMALLVVFCTVYALVLPAITVSDDPICGLEVHEHSEGCYRTQIAVPECPADLHTHHNCQDDLGNFTCGFGQVLLHKHDALCYDALQNLICPLEEHSEHLHTDGCYETTRVLNCPDEDHDHIDNCYLIKQTLICQLDQVAVHTHTTDCRDAEGNFTCGITTATVHVHDEGCFSIIRLDTPELICQLEAHAHNEACYVDAFGASNGQEFRCGFGAHVHTDSCKENCSVPEHTHDASCKLEYYDPSADLESATDWEATFENVQLTGNWRADILSIAQSQIGYHESQKNAYLWGDGILRGYTRYGQWYGAPYIDWSAAFVSFCVHYAGAEAIPQDSSCASYMRKMELADLLHKPGYYLPNPGDLVFFSTNGATADHMGIVAELLPDATGELSKIKVLAGDSEDQVQYVTYDLMDAAVLGYGEIAEGDPLDYVCGNDDHEHTRDCYQWTVYYTDDNMMVQATIQGVEALPENLSLAVKQVTKASDPLSHTAMSAALDAQITATPYFMSETGIYRMELLSDGTVYALPDHAKVNVKVTFTQPIFSPKAVKNAAKLQTFLLTQGNTASTFAMRTAPAASYLAEEMTGESYENAQHGVTGLEFSTTQLGSFAVVLSNSTMTGSFWTRVTSTSELAAGGTFMIVSAEGNYALRGDNSNNYVPVTLEAVKGNTQYYTITSTSTIDSNLYWSFTGSGSSYVVKNLKTGNYLAPGRVKTGGSSWRPTYTEYVIQSSSATLKLSYHTPENCWRLQNNSGSYYLRNAGGAFAITNANDGQYNSSTPYYYTRDMLIFKLSDVAALEIPEDVVNKNDAMDEGGVGPAKPNYGDFIVPSTSQTGTTDVTDQNGSVSGSYYSDPATSNIESQFRQDSFADSSVIDGKVVTDKSVIYGMDDYGAFSDYAKNTFSITMSALGQEYPVPEQHQVRVPVDVMFVLDVSGSMSSNASESGQNKQRAIDMAKAVNSAIGEIMDDHPANRIGIVLYSGGAWEMLPLSRYTATNGEYVTYKEQKFSHSPTNVSFTITYVLGSSSLKDQYTGKSYANAGNDAVQGIGTYTQAGIAMGHKVFSDIGDDTTYTTTVGIGDTQRTYTVDRQPVFILLSDGEPTYSTNIYNDVLNGPHYGDGNAASQNGKGIHGFNTILSANYYKRMVGIQYDRPALFYTVGVGINETEDNPLQSNSYTSDTYKRAVLNPSVEVITNLSSKHSSASYTVDQLKSLMLGTFQDQYITTRSQWPEKWTGIPHINIPTLRINPYADDYSYADGAYFGDLDESALKEIFSDIYELSSNVSIYGFILYKDSSVDMVDPIGDGMEIKGTPVLRYGGINYTDPQITVSGNVTTYTYEGTYKDPYIPNRIINLADIQVTVTTDQSGRQTVRLFIPDTALPTYTPELIGLQYYYESLPVRLIYQVGLTAESEQAVLDLQKTGGSLTFYTNQWEDVISTSTLLPSTANPFYYRENGLPPYQPHHSLKSDNTTETADYHVDCTRTIETYNGEVVVRVIHKQGNNGKLVFEAEGLDIPVEKIWDGVDADLMNPVEVTLYKVTDVNLATGGIRRYAEPVATGWIDRNNDWAYVFQGVSTPSDDWYYAIAESVPAGYRVSYGGEKIDIILDDNSTIAATKVDISDPENISVTITNSPGTILPATGGFGSLPYTLGGLMLIITASAALLYRAVRRKEDSPAF